MGLIKYLFINPCLISSIIWEDVTQDDFNCPTIIDKKINTINCSKEYPFFTPSIEIKEWLLELNINDQIEYSINKPDRIANNPIKALPLYSNALILFILNIEKYFFKQS